jgi:hypothetical protein
MGGDICAALLSVFPSTFDSEAFLLDVFLADTFSESFFFSVPREVVWKGVPTARQIMESISAAISARGDQPLVRWS